jgi:hypothetical protein
MTSKLTTETLSRAFTVSPVPLSAPTTVDIHDWRPDGPHHGSIAPTIYYGGIGQKPPRWAEAT